MPAFGRRIEFDDRSRDYPVRALLGPRRVPTTRYWLSGTVLDQGAEGACVGFSWSHELSAEPVPVADITNITARQVYRRAQQLDQWPGEDYEGTSVLAGAKAIAEGGWLLEYRWAFGLIDLLETLSYLGPVVLGVNWYSGMMFLNTAGLLEVKGEVVGGHAILACGIDTTSQRVLLQNSWGSDWGLDGFAWITWGDLDRLLREDGEACVPVVRAGIEPEPEPIEPEPVPPEPEPIEPMPEGCVPRWAARWITRKDNQ